MTEEKEKEYLTIEDAVRQIKEALGEEVSTPSPAAPELPENL